jgi:hypothetical protein
MSPAGWHLFSVVKHLLAVAMLGLLVWRLLRDRAAALLAMSLFAFFVLAVAISPGGKDGYALPSPAQR